MHYVTRLKVLAKSAVRIEILSYNNSLKLACGHSLIDSYNDLIKFTSTADWNFVCT